MGKILLLCAVIFTVPLGPSEARACPLCESETGERVRAGIFDGDFGYHLAVTLLPFPLFLGIVYLIHSGPPWARGRSGRPKPDDSGDTSHPRTPTREDRSWTRDRTAVR